MRQVTPAVSSSTPPFRLPLTIKPYHYDIEIEPNMIENKFRGKVIMSLEVLKTTNVIAFHALNLTFTHTSVKSAANVALTSQKPNYEPEHEIAFIVLKEQLPVGSSVVLTLEYMGEMTVIGGVGLSPVMFHTSSDEVKWGFGTMLQPTMARGVFPCFDEPDIKASFTISLIVDTDLTCLSNMDVASEEPTISRSEVAKKRVSFNPTLKMSTYLVVLVGGYYNYIESKDFRTPIRLWAALDKDINNAAYALEVAAKAMNTFEQIFGLKYPLPKLDLVAIPKYQK